MAGSHAILVADCRGAKSSLRAAGRPGRTAQHISPDSLLASAHDALFSQPTREAVALTARHNVECDENAFTHQGERCISDVPDAPAGSVSIQRPGPHTLCAPGYICAQGPRECQSVTWIAASLSPRLVLPRGGRAVKNLSNPQHPYPAYPAYPGPSQALDCRLRTPFPPGKVISCHSAAKLLV